MLYPLHFRYVTGSVGDVSPLVTTMRELKAHGVNTRSPLSDANIIDLCAAKVSFVFRLKQGSVLTKRAMDEHLDTLVSMGDAVSSNGRQAFVKCLPVTLYSQGDTGYLYLCCDLTMKAVCTIDLVRKELDAKGGAGKEAILEQLGVLGFFGLVTMRKIGADRVLQPTTCSSRSNRSSMWARTMPACYP